MGNRVAFRVDASVRIGTGHVMRCLTLANALRERDYETVFLTRSHHGSLTELILGQGHRVIRLPEPTLHDGIANSTVGHRPGHADWLGTSWQTDARQTVCALESCPCEWLVVDHYALDAKWEKEMGRVVRRILVIDDLADRAHMCDLLLDTSVGRQTADYEALGIKTTAMLLGPEFALLRPEFREWRMRSLEARAGRAFSQILVSMGGTDPDNLTSGVLKVLAACGLGAGIRIVVILGATCPWEHQVRQAASMLGPQTEVLVSTIHMARLLSESDLVIGAPGTSSWERCCLGIPSLMVVLAENQRALGFGLMRAGVGLLKGEAISLEAWLPAAVENMARDEKCRIVMSHAAAALVDGLGVQRVVARMEALA